MSANVRRSWRGSEASVRIRAGISAEGIGGVPEIGFEFLELGFGHQENR